MIEVPGRSFPVEKRWLDDTIHELEDLRLPQNRGGWVLHDKSVVQYLQRELVPSIPFDPRTGRPVGEIDDLDMPYPLLALIIAHVLKRSDDGHVLVFLPGWDEIQAVRNILMDRHRYPLFDLDFANSRGDLEIHVLHSSIPLAEQQAVFEPPREGVRRIVLSTNIAETSVTIPDVVFVVDSAKCKEKRYDPERRLSQLVSAWTGTSNVLQRAGRAGRHRPGEYYGIVSKARFASMDIHQTVEMLRTDLASTAMHVTGLQLPGLSVFDVLSSTIQPPEPQRVTAALETLLHVGAIDRDEKLTSLGRVLLQLPVEAAIGKLCLLGSFFRCLDQTLTLAAILTNRDPFLSPPAMKAEADRIKNTWAPTDFRGDPFAILKAYNAWWELQSRADYNVCSCSLSPVLFADRADFPHPLAPGRQRVLPRQLPFEADSAPHPKDQGPPPLVARSCRRAADFGGRGGSSSCSSSRPWSLCPQRRAGHPARAERERRFVAVAGGFDRHGRRAQLCHPCQRKEPPDESGPREFWPSIPRS